MITDAAGGVVRRHDYFAFGEDTAPMTGDPRRFTGKELDPETALQYFGRRYYRNVWGRFTSVDPVMNPDEAVEDPQRWNRYSYALNRPTKFIDPDGRNPLLWLRQLASSQAVQRLLNSTPVRTATNALSRGAEQIKVVLGQLMTTRGGVWDSIKATQPNWAGTIIPRSFELATQAGKVWVHPNATEHLVQFAKHLAERRGLDQSAIGLGIQLHITSMQAAVEKALQQGVVYGKMIVVDGWQLIFGAPSKPGLLPVLFHARFEG